eukprot:3260686-Alexandrium_andersonii.AAC.1
MCIRDRDNAAQGTRRDQGRVSWPSRAAPTSFTPAGRKSLATLVGLRACAGLGLPCTRAPASQPAGAAR